MFFKSINNNIHKLKKISILIILLHTLTYDIKVAINMLELIIIINGFVIAINSIYV